MPIHAGYRDYLLHSLRKLLHQSTKQVNKLYIRLEFCAETTDRTGDEDNCPLATAFVRYADKNGADAQHAVCHISL